VLHSHPRYLIAADAGALLLVELVLFSLSRIRYALSPLAFLVLGTGVLVGFAADVARWLWRGARVVEITDEALIVYRGRSLASQALPRNAILSAKVTRLPGSRKALLRTVSGKRVMIAEIAFPHEEFSRFLTVLEEWAPR